VTTRGIPLVVERSPGGLNGWNITAGPRKRFLVGGEDLALEEAMRMVAPGLEERIRVVELIRSELRRRLRVEVVVEVVA